MKVRHDEGVANRIDPKPCDAIREGCVEASVGERIGQPLSRESLKVSGADVIRITEGDMDGRVRATAQPGVVEDPGMCGSCKRAPGIPRSQMAAADRARQY